MQEILEKLRNTRETLISIEYTKALADFNLNTLNNPLAVEYTVSSGCTTREITEEITRRFKREGVEASANVVTIPYSICIKLPYSKVETKRTSITESIATSIPLAVSVPCNCPAAK